MRLRTMNQGKVRQRACAGSVSCKCCQYLSTGSVPLWQGTDASRRDKGQCSPVPHAFHSQWLEEPSVLATDCHWSLPNRHPGSSLRAVTLDAHAVAFLLPARQIPCHQSLDLRDELLRRSVAGRSQPGPR